MKITNFFANPDIMVVLTTSTAGLGHKRVTAALEQGLPHHIHQEELGARDPLMQSLHRIASLNVFLRWFIEKVQNTPAWDGRFARNYSRLLRKKPWKIYQKLKDQIERRYHKPEIVLVVCTHFSLAHKLAAIKMVLSKNLKTKVVLAVVVTDDSPQKIWAVTGADYLFVPSHSTRNDLQTYFARRNLTPVPEIVVTPYPVSPLLGLKLSEEEFADRLKQVMSSKHPMKIMMPVSGAAVQLKFLMSMVNSLCRKEQAEVTFVSREAKNTQNFIQWAQDHPSVNIIAKPDDRDVVSEYDLEFLRNVYSLEITKPSEQAFKTLLKPTKRGGVIMLFTKSVGRQEDDNVRFMTRHGLLPDLHDAEIIARVGRGKTDEVDEEFLQRARKWRGILLPMEGRKAGRLVKRLKKLGVFAAMMDFSGYMDHEELRSDGVAKIWGYLEQELR